jgi:RND family efflux transporter MFP subunit
MNTEIPDVSTPSDSLPQHKAIEARPAQAPGENPTEQAPRQRPGYWSWLDWRLIGFVILVLVLFLGWRLTSSHARAVGAAALGPGGLPETVAVARVTREDLFNELPIPAEFRPYLQVDLHAKVSGFLERIDVDIGDRVKAGQLLATLEVPELRDEINRALAAEKRAAADYKDAHLVYTRLLSIEKARPNLVAQQELDAAEAKDSTCEAAIAAAKADREKYQTLLSYTRITAPFDGVITRRYADPGALIQAGIASETQSKPLVQLSDNYRLRLDFPISVTSIKDIRVGDLVQVEVESLGNKKFSGTISRSTQKVDDETRTMRAEIEVPNPSLEVVPGMYARALLKVQRRTAALAVPIEAILQEKRPSVYLIDQAQQIEERPVVLGMETPTKYEVVNGLKEGDLVVVGGLTKVRPGQKVEPKLTGSLAQQ